MTRMLTSHDMGKHETSPSGRILTILQPLKGSADGLLLYNLVEQLLAEMDRAAVSADQKLPLIINHLAAYCANGDVPAADLHTRLGLLRKLAAGPFPESSLETLFPIQPGQTAEPAGPAGPARKSDLSEIVSELINEQTGSRKPNSVPAPKAESRPATGDDAPLEKPSARGREAPIIIQDETAPITASKPLDPFFEPAPLNPDRGELSQLRNSLLRRISGTSEHYNEFAETLNDLLGDLNSVSSAEQLEQLRGLLQRKLGKMIDDHRGLASDLSSTTSEIEKFDLKFQQLNRELGEAKQLSLTDELTGLPNRRAFLRRLANESGRVQRYGYPLAVALIDLDLFKDVNDTLGHEAGDNALKVYTERVLSTFRNYDLVARYGGEEFAVLLPHTDGKGAERALNKVRKCAMETSFVPKEGEAAQRLPTFSAGIAMYRPGEPTSDLIDRADRAMYDAKRHGRNRVELLLN